MSFARLPGGEVVLLFAVTIALAALLPALPGGVLGRVLAQQLIAVGGSALVVARLAGLRWDQVVGRFPREGGWWIGVALITLGWALLQAPLLDAWGALIGAQPPAWWADATAGQGPGSVALMVLTLVVVPPLAEELFFRGVFQARASALGTGIGIVGPAIVFAVYHMDPYGFPVQLASGVALGALRWYSGGIALSVFAHALNNGLGVVELARAQGPLLPPIAAAGVGTLCLVAGAWCLRRTRR